VDKVPSLKPFAQLDEEENKKPTLLGR